MRHRKLDKIDKYILGEMTATELVSFEAVLKTDADLKTSVAIRKAIHQELGQQYQKELKGKLISFDKQLDKQSWISNPMKYAAATILVLIGVFAAYQFNSKPAVSAYDFYEEGINNYMNDNAEKVQFNNAMSTFRNEEYALAKSAFKGLLIAKPTNDTLNYYVGVCYFRNGEFDKSVEAMKTVLLLHNSIYYDKAAFRLALSYYANNKKDLAKPMFKTMADNPLHSFNSEAQELLANWK